MFGELSTAVNSERWHSHRHITGKARRSSMKMVHVNLGDPLYISYVPVPWLHEIALNSALQLPMPQMMISVLIWMTR